MKRRKILVGTFLFIFIYCVLIFTIISVATEKNDELTENEYTEEESGSAISEGTEQTKVEVTYEYDEATNTVLATKTSDKELQNTKISWKLS